LGAGVNAKQVYWLLPARSASIRGLIRAIARACGDTSIETSGFTGPDWLHLTSAAYM
jgi:hypothetical protein